VDGTWVCLDSWIVQDGNYGDFSQGQDAAFAVEFYPGDLEVVRDSDSTASHLGGNRYQVEGRVVFASAGAWVLDCGLWMYEQRLIYFEELAKLPGMPPLVYGWHIERIELDVAPWIEVGPRTLARDPTRPGWKAVEATDAWNDDGGSASYLLHSRLLDRPAVRHPAMPT
jgi:hypothetical protein